MFYVALGLIAWIVAFVFMLAMCRAGANEDRLRERLFREASD